MSNSIIPLRSPWLNHGGTSPDNPVLSGMKLNLKLSKHDASETLRKVWIVVAKSVFFDLTPLATETAYEVSVPIEVGVHLQTGFPAVKNLIHFTTSEHRHARAVVYAADLPIVRITLDGYDGQDPTKPLIYPLYDPDQGVF